MPIRNRTLVVRFSESGPSSNSGVSILENKADLDAYCKMIEPDYYLEDVSPERFPCIVVVRDSDFARYDADGIGFLSNFFFYQFAVE